MGDNGLESINDKIKDSDLHIMEENKETNQWCMWIDPISKTVSMKEIPNGKKKIFESEQARVEFGAMLVFKGYKIG